MKVRNRYFKKINNVTATKLQSFCRGCMTRVWFKTWKKHRLVVIIQIQAFIRMKWKRRQYQQRLAILYHNSSLLIQRYVKGFLTYRKWSKLLHRAIIDRLTSHFYEVKIRLHTHSQIKIRFAWRIYKRVKEAKAEKARQKALATKAKKKPKYGSVRSASKSTLPVITS
jgi:hypothetical protein